MRLLWILALGFFLEGCSCNRKGGIDGHKKIFRYPRQISQSSLDPPRQYDNSSAEIVAYLYDTLLTYNYLKRPYALEPNITAGMPEVTDEGKTLTFKIRNDVYFHDNRCFADGKGRALNAEDVAYTFKRFADVKVNRQSYALLTGMILGLDEFQAASSKTTADYSQTVAGISVMAPDTIQFKLTKPSNAFLYVLANPVLSIVPRECVDFYGEDFAVNPVGTGPFSLSYRNRLGDLKLQKNPRYHLTYPAEGAEGELIKDAGRKLPLIDEVYSPVIGEMQPGILKFLKGYLDWVPMNADAFNDMAFKNKDGTFRLKKPYADRFQLYAEPDVSEYHLVFNMNDPVVGKNVHLRRALAQAINRERFVEELYNGRGYVIHTLVPLNIAGDHRDIDFEWYPTNQRLVDIELAKAGYGKGKKPPVLKLTTWSTDPVMLRIFEYLRHEWSKAGITVEADLNNYATGSKKFQEGNFQLGYVGWVADYPDAENFWMALSEKGLKEGNNYGNYKNPSFNQLYEAINGAPDSPERRRNLRKMAEIVKEDVAVIPIFQMIRMGMYDPWIKNFKRNLLLDRQAVFVDIDAKAQWEGSTR